VSVLATAVALGMPACNDDGSSGPQLPPPGGADGGGGPQLPLPAPVPTSDGGISPFPDGGLGTPTDDGGPTGPTFDAAIDANNPFPQPDAI
jgi:hypothetical protein